MKTVDAAKWVAIILLTIIIIGAASACTPRQTETGIPDPPKLIIYSEATPKPTSTPKPTLTIIYPNPTKTNIEGTTTMPIFTDGKAGSTLETAHDLSAWAGSYLSDGTTSASTTQKHSASYSVKHALSAVTGAYASPYVTFSAQSTVYASGWFYVSSLPDATKQFSSGLYLTNAETHQLCNVHLYNNAGTCRFRLVYLTGAFVDNYLEDNTIAVQANTWYYVQARLTIGAGSGVVQMWACADGGSITVGSPLLSATGLTNNGMGTATITQFVLDFQNVDSTAAAINLYSDDVTVDTTFIALPTAPMQTLQHTGIGDDYLVYYNNGSPIQWYSQISKFAPWQFDTARIGFAFSGSPGTHTFSVYDQTKMDDVLTILAANGIKAILTCFNINDMQGYCGSQHWVDSWVAVATHYAGDTRIAGFNIFNEATPATWATSGPVGNVNTVSKLHEAFAYCINQIRSVDPTRTIFYPVSVGMGYDDYGYPFNWNLYKSHLDTAGVTALGNIVYDVIHPYFWEREDWDYAPDPVDSADYIRDNLILPSQALLGTVWVGEHFPWGPSQGDYTPSIQIEFSTEIFSVCTNAGVGFIAMAYLTTDHQSEYDDALAASDYAAYIQWEGDSWSVTVSAGAGGTVNPSGLQTVNVGASLTVTAYPSSGYQLSGWLFDSVSVAAINPYIIGSQAANSSHTLQAQFSLIPTWTLNASAAANGSVSAASQTAPLITDLTVTAQPNVDYMFDHWTLNGTYAGVVNPKTVASGNSTATQTLVAYFQVVTWTLNASVSGTGGTVSSASQTAVLPNTISVTAIPDANYVFDHWLLNGAATAATNPKVVSSGNSSATQTLVAYFTHTQWTLTASAGANGSVSPAGATTANTGTPIIVTAQANVDYTFSSWTLDGGDGGATNPRSTTDAGLPTRTLVANFTAVVTPPWTLHIISGVGGTTDKTGDQTAAVATPIAVEATANGGFTFSHWLFDGVNVGGDNPYSAVDGGNTSRTLQPVFTEDAPEPATWQLSILEAAGGVTDPTGVQTEDVGTQVTITATADSGYTFSYWLLDGVVVPSMNNMGLLLIL